MNIQIVNQQLGEGTACFELACGNKSAFVTFPKSGGVWVCCQNAAHKVWNGGGKSFANVEEALDNYRSPEMKAMIRYADAVRPKSPARTIPDPMLTNWR